MVDARSAPCTEVRAASPLRGGICSRTGDREVEQDMRSSLLQGCHQRRPGRPRRRGRAGARRHRRAPTAARGRRVARAAAGTAMSLRGVKDVLRVRAGKFKRRRSKSLPLASQKLASGWPARNSA